LIGFCISVIGGVIFLIVMLICLEDIPGRIINPQYHALKDIFLMVTNK
jgi:hypothetical protein